MSRNDGRADSKPTDLLTKKRFWGCLLALGASSVAVQLVMIREVMSSFSGNELVIGLVLGAWLLFTGLGIAAGVPLSKRVRPEKVLFWGHILIAFLPFAQIVAFRALPLLSVRGVMLGLGSAVFSGAAVLVPYCVVAGAMIPVAGSFLEGRQTTGKVYFADTVGDIIGGLLFSFVFVYTLSHWDSMACLGLLNFFAASLMISRRGYVLLIVLGLGIIAARPFQGTTTSWRFPGQQVILHKNTPFAQLTITKTGQQLNVLQDAIPLFSTNALEMEAKAHLPLCQVQQGANVLLIAGGVFGTIDEIAKHHPKRIDYVELDPAIVDLDRLLHESLLHPYVHTHTGDGRLFVKKAAKQQYDAIVVDLPDPENTQLNRFYSEEFFRETKGILSPLGVLSFTLVGAENYLEETGLAVNRSVFAAVNRVFKHVLVFPGPTHFYLASERPLTTEVGDVLSERRIGTKYLADYELPTITDPFRMDSLRSLLVEVEAHPNQDLSPTAFGHLLDLWLKKSGSPKYLLYILFALSLGFAVFSCRHNPMGFTVMTSGYAGMAMELSLLLLFQVIYGYVYLRLCLFVTLFMVGSALGVLVSERLQKQQRWKKQRLQVLIADIVMVVLALLAWVVTVIGVGWKDELALLAMQYAVIPLLIFGMAFAAGSQFSAASRIVGGTAAEITGRLYVADLAGAACGTILTGLLFVPKIGIIGVLVSVVVLKGLSLALNMGYRQQNPAPEG